MSSVKDQVHRLVGEAPAAGDLYILAELSQEFAQSLDIDDTLRNAVTTIIRYLDAEAASVFLLEDEELVCRASAGSSPITGLRLPKTHGIVGRTLATGDCQMVRDVRADKDFDSSVDRTTGFTTRSIMCTPLAVQGRALGVLQVLNKKGDPGLFSEHDLYVLRVLGVAVSLAIHNAHMAQDLVEQKRIRQELELARELQQRLLPKARPEPFPLQGFNLSAYEVSGDFYDWFELDDGRIGFSIGDVSGKGLNAALLMVRTTSLLRGLGRAEHALPDLMRRVNAELCETSSHGMFVCVLAGIYDPAAREVTWCNAGFPAVLRRQRDGGFERVPADAPPLGILAEVEFPERRVRLGDDALYFYTDGVVEAQQPDGAMLEEEGLQQLITPRAGESPAARLDSLLAQLRGLKLRDDTTLLLLQDTGRRLLTLDLRSDPAQLREMRAAVTRALRETGCDAGTTDAMVLALDEACANVIRHAYGGDPAGRMRLMIDREGPHLTLRLRDYAGRTGSERMQPRPRDPERPGGLGLRLIDSIMDHWELRVPEDGHGNLLVMDKTIG